MQMRGFISLADWEAQQMLVLSVVELMDADREIPPCLSGCALIPIK